MSLKDMLMRLMDPNVFIPLLMREINDIVDSEDRFRIVLNYVLMICHKDRKTCRSVKTVAKAIISVANEVLGEEE